MTPSLDVIKEPKDVFMDVLERTHNPEIATLEGYKAEGLWRPQAPACFLPPVRPDHEIVVTRVERRKQKSGETAQAILDALAKKPMTARMVSNEAKLTYCQIKAAMARLMKSGKVERISEDVIPHVYRLAS